MANLTVIDIFCGAGGFSEGFRQMGFEVRLGVDRWKPAIDTFNHNFDLSCRVQDVLDFTTSVEAIESLPDTDVILGSPPCVSFSSSNISGKADKSHGITLTQTFLRIVAVKKWKKESKLKAWFMENVPRSADHLAERYSFEDLGLGEWAIANKIGPSKIAIVLSENREVINSADYGSPQARKRVIAGEIIKKGSLVIPEKTHSQKPEFGKSSWRSISDTIQNLPDSSTPKAKLPATIVDPNYFGLAISSECLTDHFYDTGLFKCEWKLSRYLKTNHPYMGRMSFPENASKPSRTVTATKIGSSREALIYRSGYPRVGDGEFRTPTVREAACLMGFPITYQFLGSEGTKWRLVGNAVCPSVSRAFAKQVLTDLGYELPNSPILDYSMDLQPGQNLNTFREKSFLNPPKRNKNSRFRRHPFKDGNMTVTLSNYDIEKKSHDITKWITSVQYGCGEGFPTYMVPDGSYKHLESLILSTGIGKEFIELIENKLVSKTAKGPELQKLYESPELSNGYLEPTELIDELASIIDATAVGKQVFQQNGKLVFENKKAVPLKQLFALYAVNRISTIANEV